MVRKTYNKSLTTLMEIFDLGPTVALTVLLVTTAILLTGVIFFIKSAPPTTITMTSGPEGSIYHNLAMKYATALQKNGIKLNVLTSNGSFENLQRISAKKTKIDLALAQAGSEDETINLDNLTSLGTLSYQPLFFFYRGKKINRLSEMKGKIVSIGHEGSGSRRLALKLLKLNGITDGKDFIHLDGESARKALREKKIDGAFLMGEDASVKVLKELLFTEDIHLMNFRNASAYVRKVDLLNKIELPEGVIDLEKNIPDETTYLFGPSVELISTKDLHPALSDMILDAAMDIHNPAGIFKKRKEFPQAVENDIPLSEDANRFYKSGKSFLYRYLPFWLASLVNRMLVSFLPMLIILIPAVRSVPLIFRWIGQMRIRRRYRALLRLEAKFRNEKDPAKLKALNEQFEEIESDVQQMKVRANLANQFYSLRAHIDYVRKLMNAKVS